MSRPRVSVLIPMYNAGEGIRLTLESLREQTFQDFEVVIVNDGSEDNSVQIAERSYPQAVIVHQANAGISEALNHGLQHCQGEYIARIDCHDAAYPRRLELQVRELDQRPELGIVGGHVMLYREDGSNIGVSKYSTSPAEIKHELLRGHSYLLHSAALMRRDLLVQIGAYDPFYNGIEDFELFCRFSLVSEFSNVDEVIMRILSTPEGLTYGGAYLSPLFELALHERSQRKELGMDWRAENLRIEYAQKVERLKSRQVGRVERKRLRARFFAMRAGLLLRSGERWAAMRDYWRGLSEDWKSLRGWIGLISSLVLPVSWYVALLQFYKKSFYRLQAKKS